MGSQFMAASSLERPVFDDGRVKVVVDETAAREGCRYLCTNETRSSKLYPRIVDTGVVTGIVGGGEQLLCCAKNPKVGEITGLDINSSQIAIFLAKIALVYDDGRKELMETANNLWADEIDFGKKIKEYQDYEMRVYDFESVYRKLGKRLSAGNLRLTAIAGDALKIFPLLEPAGTTVYLSNLPDMHETQHLSKSLEKYYKAGCNLLLCGVSSDYYNSRVWNFVSETLERGYSGMLFEAFSGDGRVLDEHVYVLGTDYDFEKLKETLRRDGVRCSML